MKNGSTHAKLLVVAIIWGVSWVAGRVVAADVPPFTAGWIRYIIAVAFFLVFLRDSFWVPGSASSHLRPRANAKIS
ncbi:MAG TPA: hypothetical protein EYQ73_04455 [Candidatus Poseidoniales archaeon]|nr:hypothetical protein [Candidatus Poseidoniales archaeon]